MFKMQIISSFTILFVLVFNILCTGNGNNDWTINFNPPKITAVPGSCALISCTFTYPDKAKPINNIKWIKCNEDGKCPNINTIFMQKVSKGNQNKFDQKEIEKKLITMLEPDLTKNNCSFIMKDMKAEDAKEYAFRVEGWDTHKSTYKPTVKIIIQDEPIMYIPPLSEGVEASLNCSAPFPCPETPPEITWWIKTRGENITNLKGDNITLITSKSLYLSTLPLTPTSKMHNATVGCDASYGNKTISASRTLEVMYVQTLQILGNGTVMEGDTLHLNCSVESHPPSSDPVWSFNGAADKIRNYTSAENLMITNVRKEHAGIYVCEMTYRNETLKASITINVTRDTNELAPGNFLGKDNLLNSTQKPTGDSNELAPGGGNLLGNSTKKLTVIEGLMKKLDIPTVLTFMAGMACSGIIFSIILCCWVSWHRDKKHKVPTENPNTDVNLEIVQTDVAEQTPLHGQLDGGTPNTAAPTDEAVEDEAAEMQAGEVAYASIDYSLLKNRSAEVGEREHKETDYAEIKRGSRGNVKQRKALQDGDDQIKTANQKQMEGEEELYSNTQVLKS